MAAFAAAESGAEENLKGFPDTRLKDTEEKQGDSAANDRSVGTPATGSQLRAIERPGRHLPLPQRMFLLRQRQMGKVPVSRFQTVRCRRTVWLQRRFRLLIQIRLPSRP